MKIVKSKNTRGITKSEKNRWWATNVHGVQINNCYPKAPPNKRVV
jgi:hypothetical protein